jgi:hypothetical protein
MRLPSSTTAVSRTSPGSSFSLGSLLLVIGLLAACLGLGRIDPLWGILAAVLAAPALGRSADVIGRQASAGLRPTSGRKLLVFLASLGLVAAAVVTTLSIAAAVAAMGTLAGSSLAVVVEAPWLPVLAGVFGLVLGILAGLSAAAVIVQRWWAA